MKKESLDDPLPPSKPTSIPASSSTPSSLVVTPKDTKKPEKRNLTTKLEPMTCPPSSSSSPVCPSSTTPETATSTLPALTTKPTKPNPNSGVGAKPSNDEQHSTAKKKKPCRKKMSKKEMNLPAAIVKMKAEQALLQLCNSRFNRICSQ
ncbi:hypothetical protein U1Q18_048354 [Sarracenia purpurea var. burkii]